MFSGKYDHPPIYSSSQSSSVCLGLSIGHEKGHVASHSRGKSGAYPSRCFSLVLIRFNFKVFYFIRKQQNIFPTKNEYFSANLSRFCSTTFVVQFMYVQCCLLKRSILRRRRRFSIAVVSLFSAWNQYCTNNASSHAHNCKFQQKLMVD